MTTTLLVKVVYNVVNVVVVVAELDSTLLLLLTLHCHRELGHNVDDVDGGLTVW